MTRNMQRALEELALDFERARAVRDGSGVGEPFSGLAYAEAFGMLSGAAGHVVDVWRLESLESEEKKRC